MTLPLTPKRLAAAYDFLRAFPPFCRWGLPPAAELRFQVLRTREFHGQHDRKRGRHVIQISAGLVGYVNSLLAVMAHEMVHAYQVRAGLPETHNADFDRFARQICRRFGFDPKAF